MCDITSSRVLFKINIIEIVKIVKIKSFETIKSIDITVALKDRKR